MLNGVALGNFVLNERSIAEVVGVEQNNETFRLGNGGNKIAGWHFDQNCLFSANYDGSLAGHFIRNGIRSGADGNILSKCFSISSGGDAYFSGEITGASGTFGGIRIDENGLTSGDNSIQLNSSMGLKVNKGTGGAFSINDKELRNTDGYAGISIYSYQDSYIKIGNSGINFFESARIVVKDLSGNASGIYAIKCSTSNYDIYYGRMKALNVTGCSLLCGKDFTEVTVVHGSSNTRQLLASCVVNYPLAFDRSRLWWDISLYSFLSPISEVTRLREGHYRIDHNIVMRPSNGVVNPDQHVTDYLVEIHPIDPNCRFGNMVACTDTYFEYKTADADSPNDSAQVIIDICNITHYREFAWVINSL